MDFRDTLSADLPAPRDDEPAGLRREIVDELVDHLACSYDRELLRGMDPGEARRRVIERFGDPAAVACRLWLDAMKGKIMARRVVLATCLVVTLASLSVAGAMWRQSAMAQRDSARAVAEAIRLMSDQNEKAQASQEALLKQLHEMSETIQSTKSLDWNPVTFKVTEETADGPPVAGAEITLTEQGGTAPGWRELASRVSDGSGVADFGVVRPGDYSFQVTRSWDQGSELTTGQFKVEPGSRIDRRVVCPKVPLGRVPVRIRLNWPADLAKENLALYASFVPDPIRRDELSWTITDMRPSDRRQGLNWNRMLPRGTAPPMKRSLLVGPGTAIAQVRATREAPYLWTSSGNLIRSLRAEVSSRDLRELKPPSEAFELEQGTYRPSGLLILRPSSGTDAAAGRRSFDVVLASEPTALGPGNSWWVWTLPPTDQGDDGPRAKAAASRKVARAGGGGGRFQQSFSLRQMGRNDLILPWESWLPRAETFEAQPGRVNEWTIPLPDELLEAVRKRLKDGGKVEKEE